MTAQPQILLVLIGLPGSGKTTFAEALVKRSETDHPDDTNPNSPRHWLRASQDDAPSRRRQECEARVRNGLKQAYNVVVDRVGFDAVQRSHFVNIADSHLPRPKVYAMYLEVSVSTLEARLLLRTEHPTLADPTTAMRVLADMKRQLSPPRPEGGEGFDRIYTLPESCQPADGQWSAEHIDQILELVENEGGTETVPRRSVESRQPTNHFARGGRGGFRGRADHQGRGSGFGPRGTGYHGVREGFPGQGRHPAPYPVPGATPSYVPRGAYGLPHGSYVPSDSTGQTSQSRMAPAVPQQSPAP